MPTVIAIANQKGGTAKTTTAAALAVLLGRAGVKTHVIDMDPQASLTLAFGETDAEGQLYASLRQRSTLPIVEVSENVTLSPSSIDLLRGETEFMSETARELILRAALEATSIADDAIVIIDCPPSLGVLSIACLAAADYVCLVVQPGGFELHTLAQLSQTVEVVRQRTNSRLSIMGTIMTNCHSRRAITEHVARELTAHYVLLGRVRSDAQLLYATTAGRIGSLMRSRALNDYQSVVFRMQELVPCLNA